MDNEIEREKVRYVFGWTILFTHFATIAAVFVYGINRLQLTEVVGAILTVAPLTSLYLMAFLRHVVAPQVPLDKSKMPRPAYFVQLVLVLLFCFCLLVGTVYLFWSATIAYENIGVYTGLVETLFAVYMALIFNSLFPETVITVGSGNSPPSGNIGGQIGQQNSPPTPAI